MSNRHRRPLTKEFTNGIKVQAHSNQHEQAHASTEQRWEQEVMEHKEETCTYCGHIYPEPVGYYHSEAECLENQKAVE